MRLEQVEIQGFRSFAASNTLDFTTLAPGLYHVAGHNEVEPELEGNGAGKSSLFDAVFWTLYDRTSRGLRAGAVKNWHSKLQCAGIVSLVGAAGPMSVMRCWQPNALEVAVGKADAEPIAQAELERLLGMSPEAFLYACYFAQFTPSFADLKPAEQTELFTAALGLQIWEDASRTASDKTRNAELSLQTLRQELAGLVGQAEGLLAHDHEAECKAWEKERRKRASEALAALREAEAAVERLRPSLERSYKGAMAFRAGREKVEQAAQETAVAGHEERRLEKELATLQARDLKTCPTCGQPWTQKHIVAEIHLAKNRLENAVRNSDALLTKHDELLRSLMQYRDAESDYGKKEVALGEATITADMLKKNVASIKAEKNPHEKAAKDAMERGELLAEAIEKATREIERRERNAEASRYWIKGFKELRLSIIRTSLEQLVVESNEALFQLGLQDWGIEFDVERENKTKGITKNFSIMVRAPHTKEAVPWEAWSGGESQRLRLSIAMGFANLLTSRMGVRPNFELWDEPSTWLAQAGIEDLLEVLAERAKRQQKIILLADHRALDFGGFAGTISVTKTAAGSALAVAV